jgi:acyl dehydratase
MMRLDSPAGLEEVVGTELGVTQWLPITQAWIDRFADQTGDHQWIHTDPIRAAAGPFGATVAHGYLVMSLIPRWLNEVSEVGGVSLTLNKELRRLRFLAPVPVDSEVRARICLTQARPRPRGFWEAEFSITAELSVGDAHAFTADQVFLYQ